MGTMVDFITIVSGIPRSGTSMVMQMLVAGGMPALTDQVRLPDENNPRGYFEYTRVKSLRNDTSWLDEAIGKSLKVIHLLLAELPEDRRYRVIFIKRDLNEVVESQTKMLTRAGRTGANLPAGTLVGIFDKEMTRILKWLSEKPNFEVLLVHYEDLIKMPLEESRKINAFLGGLLNENAMAEAVDKTLYRSR